MARHTNGPSPSSLAPRFFFPGTDAETASFRPCLFTKVLITAAASMASSGVANRTKPWRFFFAFDTDLNLIPPSVRIFANADSFTQGPTLAIHTDDPMGASLPSAARVCSSSWKAAKTVMERNSGRYQCCGTSHRLIRKVGRSLKKASTRTQTPEQASFARAKTNEAHHSVSN
jgi:hypothetical protein